VTRLESTRGFGKPRPRVLRRLNGAGVFGLPAVLFLLVISVYPLAQLLVMSVHTVTPTTLLREWPYVGLSNYQTALASPQFRQALITTLVFVALVLVANTLGSLAAALILRRPTRGNRITLSLMVFVWALPAVVNGSLWRFLFAGDGAINGIVMSLGIVSEPILFLANERLALLSLAFVSLWTGIPFGTVVLRAALLDVPPELVDAARIDGANGRQVFRYVTFPVLWPTILVLTVLTVLYAFRSFDLIYVMTLGGPGTATTTLPFLAYRLAFLNFKFSLGSAVAVIAMGMVLIMAVVYLRASRSEARS